MIVEIIQVRLDLDGVPGIERIPLKRDERVFLSVQLPVAALFSPDLASLIVFPVGASRKTGSNFPKLDWK